VNLFKKIFKFVSVMFMKKRTQLNIEIDDGLLKALKLLALSRNIKLNALCKEILYEKIKSDIPGELDEIKKRISKL